MLEAEGFDDLGLDDEMIELIRRSELDSGTDLLRSDLLHRYTYLNERRNLRIELMDYTDVARGPRRVDHPALGPFFEINVYEERPGGFSRAGERFFAEFQAHLEALDVDVTLARPPPPTDDAEYWRLTLKGYTAGILAWLTAFGVTVAITGGILYAALRYAPLHVSLKRGVFVLVNAWLATPLPFPVATILLWTLPNVLAFPWTYPDYYRRVLDFALFSFPVSIALCVLIARGVFRDSAAVRGAASANHERP